MKQLLSFIAILLTNAVILWLAHRFFPQNYIILPLLGLYLPTLFLLAFIWTFIIGLTQTIADYLEIKLKNNIFLVTAYFISNFVAIWGIARIGLGFGAKSSLWVFALALISNFIQFFIWFILVKLKLSKM